MGDSKDVRTTTDNGDPGANESAQDTFVSSLTQTLRSPGAMGRMQAARAMLQVEQFDATDAQGLLDFALAQSLELSGSLYGYIYYYEEDVRVFINHAWSPEVMDACTVTEPQTRYELETTGIWGEVVRQRRPMVVNDYAAQNPLKKGCPDGHVELTRWMSVPVMVDSRIVAVAGVANKPTPYTNEDVEKLTVLMEAVWSMAERLRLGQELARERKRVQALTAKLALVDQRERAKAANRIHDEISQPLAVARLYLGAIASELVAAERYAMQYKASELLLGALQASKELTDDLNPQVLEGLGLESALFWLAEERFGDLSCSVECGDPLTGLSEEATLLVFQATREFFENVALHAGRCETSLNLTCDDGIATVVVSDTGQGFRTRTPSGEKIAFEGTGLLSARERAEHLGGKLTIESRPGAGTVVTLTLPCTCGMRYLCMYCAIPLEGDDSASEEVSHGLCPECLPLFLCGTGKPAQEFLDSLPFPVFVVNDEKLLVGANSHARGMTSMEFDEDSPALGGEVFQCVHAVKPGGCGQTVHCKTCTVRTCVIETGVTGKAMRNVEAFMDLGDATGETHMRFVVTTEKVGDVVLLTVEDAQPVAQSSP